ncbi:MAG: glycoside hydrolase family 31 protein [Candidatus Sericytochromatia bacterium]
MSQLSFHAYRVNAESLELQGSRFQARLTALAGGVWRLLLWHRPEDQQKGSWVLEPQLTVPFQSQEHSSGLALTANEGLELALNLSPFYWQFGFLKALGMTCDTPFLRQEDLPPAGMRHPALDGSDGLPMGSGLSLNLALGADDAIYGLGERTGFLNKRGRIWKNWTKDEFFHSPQADPLYQSHPFMLLRRENAYIGIYLDESWYSCFDLGYSDPDSMSLYSAGPTLDLYLIPGPHPAEILKRYTQLTGRAPLPPLWSLGAHQCRWSYPDQESVLAVAQAYREHKLPLDALWLDIDHMDGYKVFSFSNQRFPDPAALTAQLKGLGFHTVVIVDPGVKQEAHYSVYESGRQIQAFIRDLQDREYVGEVWPEPVVWPDFSQAEVRAWWGHCQDFYRNQGVAGLWIDMNEPAVFKTPGKTLPLHLRQGKHTHAELHNLYGYQMAMATWEGLKSRKPDCRPFVLTRSGCPGIQKYAMVWTGDNSSYWEHLEMSLPMLMNLGLSGVPFVGADIGGFSGDCDGELLLRWTQLGVLYPFMRNHAGKGSRRQEPWQFGEPWLSQIRAALELRYQLLPYLYSLAKQAAEGGDPLLMPLLYAYPDDPQTWSLHDQCLLGPDLLAAPVLRPGQSRRAVYLPAGTWQDFWTGKRYPGREWILCETPLSHLPLFQRCGSALPLVAPAQQTSDAWWKELIWKVAPDEIILGRVWQDAGDGYHPGQWRELSGSWNGQDLILAQTPAQACLVQMPVFREPLRGNVSFSYQSGQLSLALHAQARVEW